MKVTVKGKQSQRDKTRYGVHTRQFKDMVIDAISQSKKRKSTSGDDKPLSQVEIDRHNKMTPAEHEKRNMKKLKAMFKY